MVDDEIRRHRVVSFRYRKTRPQILSWSRHDHAGRERLFAIAVRCGDAYKLIDPDILRQSPTSVDLVQSTFKLSDEEKYLLLESDVGEGIFFAGLKHVAIKVIASYTEDQIITSDPSQILAIRKAKEEMESQQGGEERGPDASALLKSSQLESREVPASRPAPTVASSGPAAVIVPPTAAQAAVPKAPVEMPLP
jgi:hypothetical protein